MDADSEEDNNHSHWNYYTYKTGIINGDRCDECKKKIKKGQQFRWRFGMYSIQILNHRECSADDAGWIKYDKQCIDANKERRDFLLDCKEFIEKHGAVNLEDYVDDIANELK